MNHDHHYLLSVVLPQHLLYIITLLFVSLIIVISFVIIIYLFRKNRLDNRREDIRKNIGDLICEIAICETPGELEETYLQPGFLAILDKYKHTAFDKTVVTRELADTCKKVSGHAEKNIQWLFEKMDLQKDLLNQLSDKRWYVKAEAIQQMASLNQSTYLRKIYYYTNHKNRLVRMDAQITTVKLTGFKGLRFLNVISYPISSWQQLQLLNELLRQTPDNFESLEKWLRSTNETVVEFALRLVGIYQRYEQYDNVVECLSHQSKSISVQAIDTLSKINIEDTAALFVAKYHHFDTEAQFQVIRLLKAIGSQNEIPFLKSILYHPDDSFKLEAARAIQFIGNFEMITTSKNIDENSYPWNIILPQIKLETA